MSKPPRVWVSSATPKKGETVRVRAQLEHVMESGLRTDPATGKLRPRNLIKRFELKLGNARLMAWEPGISVSQNPYIEFTFLARASGELTFLWEDDGGQTVTAQKTITVA